METVEQVKELVGSIKYRPLQGNFLADALYLYDRISKITK